MAGGGAPTARTRSRGLGAVCSFNGRRLKLPRTDAVRSANKRIMNMSTISRGRRLFVPGFHGIPTRAVMLRRRVRFVGPANVLLSHKLHESVILNAIRLPGCRTVRACTVICYLNIDFRPGRLVISRLGRGNYSRPCWRARLAGCRRTKGNSAGEPVVVFESP